MQTWVSINLFLRLATILAAMAVWHPGIIVQAAPQGEELTRLEKKFVSSVQEELEKVVRYHEKEKLDQALKYHDRAVEQLNSVKEEKFSPALSVAMKPVLESLANYRKLLTNAGLSPLEHPALKMTEAGGASGGFVEVAGILNARCGNCHVRNMRGNFSMVSLRALLDSGHVDAGQPVSSRLIQVMETGEMPPNGNRVPDEEFAKIRAWVADGAKPEGDENANLAALQPGGVAAPMGAAPITELVRPKGNETVSFSRDIAPILSENCRGCHVESNRPGGGLNMTMITGLLRGGDRGGAVVAGKGSESLLVQKLKGMGDGQRMPQSAPPLEDDVIAKIEKWIDEGAAFDGDDAATPLPTLVAIARTSGMTNEEIAENRRKLAVEKWNLVFPGESPTVVLKPGFQVVASMPEPIRDLAVKRVESLVSKMRQELEIADGRELVPGSLTVFVVTRQYDFNEFSRMVVGRPAVEGTFSFWNYDQIEAWIVVLANDNFHAETGELSLVHDLSALHFSSSTKRVPRWFADSMGYVTADKVLAGSAAVKNLQAAANAVATKLESAAEVRNPGTNPTTAALGGYFYFGQLLTTSNSFKRLRGILIEADNFEAGIMKAFNATIEQLLPEKQGNNRNRGN